MPLFGSMSHARREAVTAGSAAVTVLALATACGSASWSGGGAAPGAAPAPATGPATGPAAPAASQDGAADAGTRPVGPGPAIPQVGTVVRRFYERYAADPAGAAERYLTSDLAARVRAGGNPAVFCATQAPASLDYSAPVIGDGTATVTVTAHQDGGPGRRITVAVTVPDILVSAITCPPS